MSKVKEFFLVWLIVVLLASALAAVMAATDVSPTYFTGPAKWGLIAVLVGVTRLILGKD